MTPLSPSIPINVLRTQLVRNGDHSSAAAAAVKPIFRNARRFHASPAPSSRTAPINVDSLTETLENQRVANSTPLLRKYVYGSGIRGDGNAAMRKVLARDKKRVSPSTPHPPSPTPTPLPSLPPRESAGSGVITTNPGSADESSVLRYIPGSTMDHPANAESLERDKGAKIDEPWLDLVDGPTASSGLARLNQEINAFATYMRSIPLEEEAASKIQSQLSDVCVAAGLPCPIPFGSRTTGMALRHSNINLMIPIEDADASSPSSSSNGSNIDNPTYTNRAKMKVLHELYLQNVFHILDNNPQFAHCRLLPNRTPRLHTTHLPTGLPVRIQCGTAVPTGDSYVMNYMAEYPNLPRLLTAMRMLLETRRIFGQTSHTTTSYGLTMLIVGALKLGEGTFDRHVDVGLQLLHVLRFYGYANFRRYGISLEPPGLFRKKNPSSIDPTTAPAHVRGQIGIGKRSAGLAPAVFCVQDPANYVYDVCGSFLRTNEVQELFRHLAAELEAGVLAWDMSHGGTSGAEEGFTALGLRSCRQKRKLSLGMISKAKAEGRPLSLLRSVVGGDYDAIEKLRDQVVLAVDRVGES